MWLISSSCSACRCCRRSHRSFPTQDSVREAQHAQQLHTYHQLSCWAQRLILLRLQVQQALSRKLRLGGQLPGSSTCASGAAQGPLQQQSRGQSPQEAQLAGQRASLAALAWTPLTSGEHEQHNVLAWVSRVPDEALLAKTLSGKCNARQPCSTRTVAATRPQAVAAEGKAGMPKGIAVGTRMDLPYKRGACAALPLQCTLPQQSHRNDGCMRLCCELINDTMTVSLILTFTCALTSLKPIQLV